MVNDKVDFIRVMLIYIDPVILYMGDVLNSPNITIRPTYPDPQPGRDGKCPTVCPGSSDPFYIVSWLYKMGHYLPGHTVLLQ